MFTIEKIEVYDLTGFAEKLTEKMPEIEPTDFDENGEFDASAEFDVDIQYDGIVLKAVGILRAQGYSIVEPSNDIYVPADHDFKQVTEVEDIWFLNDGLEVEVENEYDLINEINKML